MSFNYVLKSCGSLLMAVLCCLMASSGCGLAHPPKAEDSFVLSMQADGQPQTGLPEVDMVIGKRKFRLEVAVTPKQAEAGLMYRKALPHRHGMLFLFEPSRVVSFWMKNTKIPLDILFLAQGKVVHIAKNVPPCLNTPCPTYSSRFAVDMVVELPAGASDESHLIAGTPVKVDLSQNNVSSLSRFSAQNGR